MFGRIHSMKSLALALAALVLTSAPSRAQDDPVDRLDEAMQNSHTVVDTALVFTNLANAATRVTLVAYDSAGRRVGAKEVAVPGNGVEYVLASELVEATDPRRYLGKVVSRGLGRLTASAVLFGGALTDLPTIVQSGRTATGPNEIQAYTSMTFPLVATY